MEKLLWIVSLKARVLPGSPLAMDGSEFMYGECVGFASSLEDMEQQLQEDMDDAKLEVIERFFISPVTEAKWIADSEYKNSILDLIEEVKITRSFTSGIFRSSQYLGMNI